MDQSKRKKFNERMGRRAHLFNGGAVHRKHYSAGAAVSGGLGGAGTGAMIGTAITPGIGTAIGAVAGGVIGVIGGLMSGGNSDMPNIVNPVTGEQITDAYGRVVASQAQLANFSASLQGVDGVKNQQAVMAQLQGVANGTGPNPAQAMLNQTTGQNVANQAALMAGQRGAASNVGLIAREAAQQGAGIQQNAAGQAATLQANQSLNALNSEGAIAGQQVGETQEALNSASTAASNNQGQLLGAENAYNSAITAGQGNVNTNNVTGQGQILSAIAPLAAGAFNGAGTSTVNSSLPSTNTGPSLGANTTFAPSTIKYSSGGPVYKNPPMTGEHASHVANFLSQGGKVPAMVSPKEVYLSPEKVKRVLEGADPLKIGDRFQGKAKVKGDSRKNDTIPTTLEEGGVVIPRSHAMDSEKAELFTRRAVHMKRGKK